MSTLAKLGNLTYVIWERDYMRKPVQAGDNDEVSAPPKPFDIFAGLPLEELPKSSKASHSAMAATSKDCSTITTSARQSETLLVNRLLAKYPRLLIYVALTSAALAVGILFGLKFASR